ncbi:MAG TPA: hypothetical protein VIS96_13285 [Terrimicrobiaceae bacterium]
MTDPISPDQVVHFLLQNIEPAKCCNDLLAHFPFHPNAPGDLQITVTSGGLDSEEHLWRSWTPQL